MQRESPLPPRDVARVFRELFSQPEIMQEIGQVEVTLEPSADALERVLGLEGLAFLKIRLVKPNPDDHFSDEAEYRQRLADMNARAEEVSLFKDRKADRLVPDEEIRRMAAVAASNGFVEGKGFDEKGERASESTRNLPRREVLTFDALSATAIAVMLEFAAGYRSTK